LETIFNESTQDQLAIKLLERRGIREYLKGTLPKDEFAHNLSKEWAALPRVLGENPSASYYAGDGLNAAQLSIEEVRAAIETVREL
jgi:conjugal transfer mating pair stabilization protein TraG